MSKTLSPWRLSCGKVRTINGFLSNLAVGTITRPVNIESFISASAKVERSEMESKSHLRLHSQNAHTNCDNPSIQAPPPKAEHKKHKHTALIKSHSDPFLNLQLRIQSSPWPTITKKTSPPPKPKASKSAKRRPSKNTNN